ncbi:hypothetical protein SPHINGO391_500075 [Sphingomonas aurantiaca]|uniref:Uncharacterized protein n=1 Tax=Sphingomonas aurantiaca TaxID=185949 RepID=A0A5E8A8Q7_9SPHN|nr:hypothetical protein SPHINGO391_500075 [Sphingomonas aurantiaca]
MNPDFLSEDNRGERIRSRMSMRGPISDI